MISISVEVDGLGKKTYKGKKLDRKEALARFCRDFKVRDIDSLRHYPRIRQIKSKKAS